MTSQINQMTGHGSQITAPNLRIEAANGVTYAYRRFGNTETAALPLVFFVHFRANLDNWDPLLADHLPNARLSIYPDAGHGFLFQYPVEFGTEVNAFLGQ